MRYTWTSIAILVIWLSTTMLMVSGKLPDPELFFTYIMGITIILSYIGFRTR